MMANLECPSFPKFQYPPLGKNLTLLLCLHEKPSTVVVVVTTAKIFIFLQKLRWLWFPLIFKNFRACKYQADKIAVRANFILTWKKLVAMDITVLKLYHFQQHSGGSSFQYYFSSAYNPAHIIWRFYKFIVEFPFTTNKMELGI